MSSLRKGIVATVVALGALAIAPAASAEGESAATLTCTTQSGGNMSIFNVTVDYAHKTVNGDAAQIEPLLISWTDRAGHRWAIVRNNGILCEFQDASTCNQRGSCQRAAPMF